MALIKCSECGKEVSDKASSCPNCGAPIKEDEIKKRNKCGYKNREKISYYTYSCFIFNYYMCFYIWLFYTSTYIYN